MMIRKHLVAVRIIMLCICFLITSCSEQNDSYQGYVDSKLRFISSNFSGLLVKLDVLEGDYVKKGQQLFVLEQYPEKWQVDESLAKLNSAKSDVTQYEIKVADSQKKYQRRVELRNRKVGSQEDVDQAQADLALATEQLNAAKQSLIEYQAQLDESNWSVGKKTVNSNLDAIVEDVFYYQDEIVPATRPVLSLLAPEDIKIIMFVPETEISALKLGQMVFVTCDGCQKEYQAKISYISPTPEFTPPTIYSEQTRGKLTFLVEARSDLETNKQLHPGQPITVHLKRK